MQNSSYRNRYDEKNYAAHEHGFAMELAERLPYTLEIYKPCSNCGCQNAALLINA